MLIVDPLHARSIDGLLSSHPNMQNRITK